jgi:hypothetical protein
MELGTDIPRLGIVYQSERLPALLADIKRLEIFALVISCVVNYCSLGNPLSVAMTSIPAILEARDLSIRAIGAGNAVHHSPSVVKPVQLKST